MLPKSLLFIITGLFFGFLVSGAGALSPDFSRQSIADTPDSSIDDIDMRYSTKTALKSSLVPMDIKSATFASDGKVLNATIWLFYPMENINQDLYFQNNLTFTVFIDLPKETIPEPAYRLIVSPQQDGTWTRTLIEEEPDPFFVETVSSDPSPKIIDTTRNYTGFYQNGKRYVNFCIDLEKISYPSRYFVAFQTSATNLSNSETLQDWTFEYRVPPPANKITYYWQKPIEIQAGSEKYVKLYINTTDLSTAESQVLADANSSDGIHITFNPNPVSVEPTGVNFTNMQIKVNEDLYTGTPTKVNQFINIGVNTEDGVEFSDSRALVIDVLPPISIGEILVKTNLAYIIPIGVTAIIVLWISKRIDRIKNYESITLENLLTVDASVIAGVLIFLTIGSAGVFSGVIQKVGILTASIVFPFAISAIRALMMGKIDSYAVKFTVAGFVYLMTSVIVIGFVNS